jgi:methionyl-tRNA formyltransferase
MQNSQESKIVMCGCLEVGYEIIRYLLQNGINIDYFVSITTEKAEQQQVAGYQSFAELAEEFNIPIYYAEKYSLKSKRDVQFFQDNKFNLLIQGGWQRLFPEEVLKTLSVGAIGVHGSSEFLPKGRGRSPINWSLIEGKKRFIIHYFIIKPGVDDGDIFHYEIFDINHWDTCKTLYYKNSITTKTTLHKWVPKLLNNNFTALPQCGKPTYYPKRTAEDGIIDWSKTVFQIYDHVRALTRPYPGAFSYINGKKVSIWKAQPFDTRITYPSAVEGQVVETFQNGDLVINCNSGLLLLTEYSFDGVVENNALFSNS